MRKSPKIAVIFNLFWLKPPRVGENFSPLSSGGSWYFSLGGKALKNWM